MWCIKIGESGQNDIYLVHILSRIARQITKKVLSVNTMHKGNRGAVYGERKQRKIVY